MKTSTVRDNIADEYMPRIVISYIITVTQGSGCHITSGLPAQPTSRVVRVTVPHPPDIEGGEIFTVQEGRSKEFDFSNFLGIALVCSSVSCTQMLRIFLLSIYLKVRNVGQVFVIDSNQNHSHVVELKEHTVGQAIQQIPGFTQKYNVKAITVSARGNHM